MNLFFCWPTHFNCVLIFSGAPQEIHSTSGRFCPDVFPTCLSKSTYEIQLFSRSLKISIKITHEFHENPTFPRCLLLEFPGFSRIFHGNHLGNPRKSHLFSTPKWPRNGPEILCCAATAAVSASAVASAALARSACKGQRRGKNGEIYQSYSGFINLYDLFIHYHPNYTRK